MQPIVFHDRFGWLHSPPTMAARPPLGVVICSPLGRDARCAHLPMRLFAEQLARSGVPTLRYDHAGTGESLDLPGEEDALPVWLADIRRAIQTLRERTGAERVVLCGVRLGATLAAAAAVDADGLALFGPIVSGRSWTSKAAFAAGQSGVAGRPADGALDTDGMMLSGATVASLAGLDMLRMSAPPRVLVFTQGRTTDAYVRHLRQSGVTVDEQAFLGHAELFLDSHSNIAPQAAFDSALAWLADAFPAKTVQDEAAAGALPHWVESKAGYIFDAAALRTAGAVERPVRFGPGLHGVFTAPVEGRGDGRAVLFCNTGGDPRAGIGRLAVQAARELAQDGVASLRFDFGGLGDSPMPSGDPRSHVYEHDRQTDVDAALALLAAQGCTRVFAFGVCSGAYHAMHAALRDERICGVFAVNPLRLVWRGEEITFGDRADAYVGKLGDPTTWKRLLAGHLQLVTIGRALLSRLQAYLVGRATNGPAGGLRRDLARLSGRGGRMHLLVGAEDAALDEIQAYLGRNGGQLARLPGMSVQIELGLDHGLSRSASREAALKALWRWLDLGSRDTRLSEAREYPATDPALRNSAPAPQSQYPV